MKSVSFVTLHRYGEECYIDPMSVDYVGPMKDKATSYVVVSGLPLIVDESPAEVVKALEEEV